MAIVTAKNITIELITCPYCDGGVKSLYLKHFICRKCWSYIPANKLKTRGLGPGVKNFTLDMADNWGAEW